MDKNGCFAAGAPFPAKRLQSTVLKIIKKSRRLPVFTPYLNKILSSLAMISLDYPGLTAILCSKASFIAAGGVILL